MWHFGTRRKKEYVGNTLLEGVCIRHDYEGVISDMTYVLNMK